MFFIRYKCVKLWRDLYLLTESKIIGWQIAYSNICEGEWPRVYVCQCVSIKLSQFRVMKLTWFARYHIFRYATNSLYTIAMQSLLYRFISTLSSHLNLRCLLFYVFSPLLTYIHLTNTLKKCAGSRLSAYSHSTFVFSMGRRLSESSCPFDEKDNKMQERLCMTVNYPVLRNIL